MSDNEYRPIKVTRDDDVEIEFEDRPEADNPLKEVDLGDFEGPKETPEPTEDVEVEVEGEQDDQEQDEPEQKPKQQQKRKRKPSRRDKRIKQLLDEVSEERKQREELERRLYEAERSKQSTSKNYQESQKEILEKQIVNLKGQLRDALENADADKAVDIEEELGTARLKLASISYELENFQEIPEYKPQQQKQQPVDERALEWVDDHPEFKTDPLFGNAAVIVNNLLLQEGFDPDSDRFYDELDDRLSARFPEYFDTTNKSVVQYGNNASKKGPATETLEDGSDEDDIPQTVSGASRTPSGQASGKPRRKSKNTVVLSKEDQELCNRWGMSPQAMAKRKKLLESLTEESDYVPIKTN